MAVAILSQADVRADSGCAASQLRSGHFAKEQAAHAVSSHLPRALVFLVHGEDGAW